MDYQTARWRLGDRVRSIRREKNITQEELAERIDKTTEHVSYLERGERSPSFEVLIDLANALAVPLPYLMDLDTQAPATAAPLPAAVPVPLSLTDSAAEPIKPSEQRRSDLERLQEAIESIRAMQQLAKEYGIADIFQDNGGKVLQLLILLGLRISPGREGNDAIDAEGNEYELKTINRSLREGAGITTHHHLNKGIITKYRAVKAWYIAIYRGIELTEIWKLLPSVLEPLFQEWEAKIDSNNGQPLNNPKIPMRYVRKGELVYSNPQSASQHRLL